jgi:hypothetical protein
MLGKLKKGSTPRKIGGGRSAPRQILQQPPARTAQSSSPGHMGMGFAGGGKMKTKGYAGGGKIRMSPKMMANGGPTGAVKRDNAKSGVARGSGAARPQPFRKNG